MLGKITQTFDLVRRVQPPTKSSVVMTSNQRNLFICLKCSQECIVKEPNSIQAATPDSFLTRATSSVFLSMYVLLQRDGRRRGAAVGALTGMPTKDPH